MLRPTCSLIACLVLLLLAPVLSAQTFSYDGNRWYEIEVSIFSNEISGPGDELFIPENTTLTYPEPIRQLVPAISSFLVPFEEQDLPPAQPDSSPVSGEVPVMGPQQAREGGDYRLADFNRDPFIALGPDYAEFDRYNRDIRRSPEHRLLFHAVWRQPVLNRVQATALLVTGGEQYGSHHELEGSLRFSYNVNRVDVEANMWLAQFGRLSGADATRWRLPALPIDTDDIPRMPDYPVTQLYYMNQLRQMVSNDLNYLDHPALGMLVEIRPYQLPEPTGFSFD